jgi:DNA uptake protein ComE-like DNA-binding protein
MKRFQGSTKRVARPDQREGRGGSAGTPAPRKSNGISASQPLATPFAKPQGVPHPRIMRRHRTSSPRRGMVLLVVLVVVMLLSLGAWAFSESMVVEARATVAYGRDAQARVMADSAIELAASLVADRTDRNPENLHHNPSLMQHVLMRSGEGPKGMGRFSIVSSVSTDTTGKQLRFGLQDESGKLNLNTLLTSKLEEADARKLLLGIPNMTEDVADAILDWIDTDVQPRSMGAEDEYYLSLSPPYEPANGPFSSLEDLLLVKGVTPAMLFGEDANRNGLLDPSEDDGGDSLPVDNADGVLDRGWFAYFTTYSRETNLQTDDSEKINVNQGLLTELYDALEPEMGEDVAKFIVAYRIKGAKPKPITNTGSSSGSGSSGSLSSGGGRGGSGSTGNGSSSSGSPSGIPSPGGSASSSSGGSSGTPTTAQQVSAINGLVSTLAAVGSKQKVTRGGIDLTNGGQQQINSLYDLVGIEVEIEIDGTKTTLESPWAEDANPMRTYWPEVTGLLATRADPHIEGRININEAPYEVLVGIPGMTEELASAIAGSQLMSTSGETLTGQVSDRATTAWLFYNGLTDVTTLRQLDPYITSRGDVFRVQAIGYYDDGGPFCRVEAIIDGTRPRPAILMSRDLTELGRAYPLRALAPDTTP